MTTAIVTVAPLAEWKGSVASWRTGGRRMGRGIGGRRRGGREEGGGSGEVTEEGSKVPVEECSRASPVSSVGRRGRQDAGGCWEGGGAVEEVQGTCAMTVTPPGSDGMGEEGEGGGGGGGGGAAG